MTDIFQGDPAIKITPNGATLIYTGGQPELDAGLENQALISLFTAKDWPGNFLLPPEAQIGSDFEKLARGPITLSKLALIEKSAESALKAPIFGTITAVASNPESWITAVNIRIEPPGGVAFEINLVSNGQNWINQAEKPTPTHTATLPIGSIFNRLFHCDTSTNKFYRLDPDTFANLSGAGVDTPGVGPQGVGGISNRLYHCDDSTLKFYEIDPVTFANLSGAGVDTPGVDPRGIGGISNRLYHCDPTNNKFYEIDPVTLANLSGAGVDTPGSVAQGIGGIFNRLYNCDPATLKFYEIDPDTLANLSGAGISTPGSNPQGIGGISNRLYHCDRASSGRFYEIDPDTLANLSGAGISTPGSNPLGIGGIK